MTKNMADRNKRPILSEEDSIDNRRAKRNKGGSGGKWQTTHQRAKADTNHGGGKIEPGDVGIWVTCQRGTEGKATEELKAIFAAFTEQIYGVVADTGSKAKANDDSEDDADEGIEAAIRKEVVDIGAKKVILAKLIKPVYLDIQCVLFFKTRPPIEPVSFVQRICEEAVENPKGRKTRFANRLTPMKIMGRANEKGLEEVGRCVLREYFSLDNITDLEGPREKKTDFENQCLSYAIRPTIRNHSTLKRDVVIKLVASLVAPRHKVDLTNPDKVIIVEIYQTVCGMSVVDNKDWERLRRFNLAEIYQPSANPVSQPVQATKVGGTTTSKGGKTDEKFGANLKAPLADLDSHAPIQRNPSELRED